jgi:exo-beta-1,3-glucanase (GH17 family)
MSRKSNTSLLSFALFIGICLSVVLIQGVYSSQIVRSESSSSTYPISIVPDQMTLAGDVTTRGNCIHATVCSWLDDTPTGTIMLGVDPSSSETSNWNGGSATAELFLTDIYSPTVLVLHLAWPDQDGKGLHSPEQNRAGTIILDGQVLWSKRTTDSSTFGDYYAAEHEPILTTIVVTQSITHTLSFSVSARTTWDLSQIELAAFPYPTTIKGIGYSPLRDCQYPGGKSQPSVQDIQEDLFRLFHTSNAIRTYSATGVSDQIVELTNAIGLPVFVGAWIDYPKTATLAQDDAEIQALIDLACTNDLEGVIVGNEYYLRSTRTVTDINYLLQRIQEVDSGIHSTCGKDVPITTAEIDDLMFGWEGNPPNIITGTRPTYRPILDEIDFIMVHTYPFWSGMRIDGAAAFTVARYKAIQTLIDQEYPGQGKWIIIGETGWPSEGAPNRLAAPTPRNQRRYILEFLPLAEQKNVEYMYFDAFDELWKIEEPGRVGQNWGYSYSDRSAKHNFYGVLLPTEHLPSPPEPFSHTVYLPHISSSGSSSEQDEFYVYTEWLDEKNHFVPSGWMEDVENISIYECDRTNPHNGEMAIRVSFSPTGTEGWAGIYWQDPADNWGQLPGGYDLTGAGRLTFWVRGDQGGEVVEFLVGGLGESTDPYGDTIQPARLTGPIILSDTWQQVEISLAGADLSRVIGGFAWVAGRCYNSEPITFYIDDVVFDFDPAPEPLQPLPRAPFYVYDDDDSGCNHFSPSGWMGDIDDIFFDQAWTNDPRRGATAIRITYSAFGSNGQNWAGIYWQEPENNWGDLLGGYDLTGANRLTFWVRGDQGDEIVEFLVGGIGEPGKELYPDTIQPARSSGLIALSSEWESQEIDLTGADLSRVIGGFAWVASRSHNSGSITFYLDDIVYSFE